MAESTAPTPLDAAALERIGGPIAAQLLPGWTITWVACSQEEIDALRPPGPNLAVCRVVEDTTPTRELAQIHVVTPWPANERLFPTIAHEVTHAWISPIVACIPDSEAAVMLEEQLVERMGNFLAGLPAAARRAVRAVVDSIAPPRVRARISALASQASAAGGQMDPVDLILAAAEAAAEAADPKEALTALIAKIKAIKSGEAPESVPEPAAQEPATPGAGAPPTAAQAADEDPVAAAKRARLAAIDADLERMHAAKLPREKAELVRSARARLAITPATEKRIMAAPTFAEAERILSIVEEAGGGTSARARSGVEHRTAPDASEAVPKGEDEETLIKDGFDEQWRARYRARLKDEGAEAGALMLATGRAAKARTRARLARDAKGQVAS